MGRPGRSHSTARSLGDSESSAGWSHSGRCGPVSHWLSQYYWWTVTQFCPGADRKSTGYNVKCQSVRQHFGGNKAASAAQQENGLHLLDGLVWCDLYRMTFNLQTQLTVLVETAGLKYSVVQVESGSNTSM